MAKVTVPFTGSHYNEEDQIIISNLKQEVTVTKRVDECNCEKSN